MKPEFEALSLDQHPNSFNFFEVETPAFKPFWHYHPELELTLITKGSGTRFVGNSILPYKEGDLVLLGENLPHHWVSANETKEQGAIVIQFPVSIFNAIKECAHFATFFKEAEVGFHFPAPTNELLRALHQFGKASAVGQVSQLMMILEALQTTDRQGLSSFSNVFAKHLEMRQTKVSDTINYILDHLHRRLTVDELSDFANMVPQSFCRWFKKSVGMSFITFVNTARVENACQDLRNSDKSIFEVAFENGFDSLSHFNRTFKKVKNEVPSKYRLGK